MTTLAGCVLIKIGGKQMKKERNIAKLFLLTSILSGLFIYANELLRMGETIDLFDYTVSTGIFIYPFTFYVVNVITREFETIDAIKAVLFAVMAQALIFWLGGLEYGFALIMVSSIKFILAQAVNVYIAGDLISKRDNKYVNWFMLYVLILALDTILYVIFISNYTPVVFLSGTIMVGLIIKTFISALMGLGEILVLKRK